MKSVKRHLFSPRKFFTAQENPNSWLLNRIVRFVLSRILNDKQIWKLSAFKFFTNTQIWQRWHYWQICIPIHLQFSSLFASNDVSKREIGNQGVLEDYISRLHIWLDLLIFDLRAKMKLTILAFLCWREFVKNSIEHKNCLQHWNCFWVEFAKQFTFSLRSVLKTKEKNTLVQGIIIWHSERTIQIPWQKVVFCVEHCV